MLKYRFTPSKPNRIGVICGLFAEDTEAKNPWYSCLKAWETVFDIEVARILRSQMELINNENIATMNMIMNREIRIESSSRRGIGSQNRNIKKDWKIVLSKAVVIAIYGSKCRFPLFFLD